MATESALTKSAFVYDSLFNESEEVEAKEYRVLLKLFYKNWAINRSEDVDFYPSGSLFPEITASSDRARLELLYDLGNPSSVFGLSNDTKQLVKFEHNTIETDRVRRTLLNELAKLCNGSNKAYAELALSKYLKFCQNIEIKIMPSPEGGVLFEHLWKDSRLTLLIEGNLGIIINSGDCYRENFNVDINAVSINILLERYQSELKFLSKI